MNRRAVHRVRQRPARGSPVMMWAAAQTVLAVMAGCAACPPFQVAWYLDDSARTAELVSAPAPAASAPTLLLALINKGPDNLQLTSLDVNPGRSVAARRLFEAEATKPLDLWPGELRLIVVKDEPCTLPLAVRVACTNGAERTQAVAGSLPNYVHDRWVEKCVLK